MTLYPDDTPAVRDAAQPDAIGEELADGRLVIHDGATNSGVWIEGETWTVRP